MEPQGSQGTRRTAVDGRTPQTLDWISGMVVTSAMTVHSALGPGLLESAYEACLVRELELRGLRVRRQVMLPLRYRGAVLDVGYRLDLLVEEQVVAEVKAVKAIDPIHRAQLLSYLRLSGMRLGLLLNFHALRLKHGIVRMRNDP